MKRVLLSLVFVAVGAIVVAQQNVGVSYTHVAEINTDPATNYYAKARTSAGADAPSTNAAVWHITRVVTDSNGEPLSIKHAYGSGAGDLALWTTSYTNRASATYK